MRDSDWCVPVKHVAKLSRVRGSTSTKTSSNSLLIQRKRTETMTQHRIARNQNSSPWKMMSVSNAAVVRLVALSRSEREISPPRSQVYVFPARQMQTSISSRRGNTDLCELQQKHLGTVATASGCRFRSWRNSHASGLVDKPSFDRVRWGKVYNEGQRKLDVCTLDGQQRKSITFHFARVKKGSGISKSNGEEREQTCF